MSSSLDALSSYLMEFDLEDKFTEINEEQLKLLNKKGIMPYDYIDSFNRFSETN